MKNILISIAAAAGFAGAAAADVPPPSKSEEASIPFFSFGHFRTFQPVDDETLYVEGRPQQWYRVTTLGPCFDLPWANRIGVDTRGSNSFDRFSTLLVDGQRCRVDSVVRADGPPRRKPRT